MVVVAFQSFGIIGFLPSAKILLPKGYVVTLPKFVRPAGGMVGDVSGWR
jgi:hypothetical protein